MVSASLAVPYRVNNEVNALCLHLPLPPFAGTVIRTTTIKVLEGEREFVCSRCGHSFTVEADFEQYYTIPRPSWCECCTLFVMYSGITRYFLLYPLSCPSGDCGSIKFTQVGRGRFILPLSLPPSLLSSLPSAPSSSVLFVPIS